MSPLGPGSVVAGWRVERLLGAGAMGSVYLALGVGGERAALKVVPDELAGEDRFRRRFEREARLAAAISHPHVVDVLDSGEADGRLFIVMRYVDGRTWRRRSPSAGAFTRPMRA
jgi:serine/threonine protein kinase